MKTNMVFGFALASMLVGCVTATPPDVSKMSIADVCEGYKRNLDIQSIGATGRFLTGSSYDSRYAKEIERRDFFSEEEKQLIRDQKVQMGMRSELLRCIFGYPSDINRTVTSNSTSEQWVFRNHGWYVYVENGVVTSWQN